MVMRGLVKRRKIPGVIDVIEVDDASEITSLARDPRLDRTFEASGCPVNRFLLTRSLKALSFGGNRFPTMMPRGNQERAQKQQELWTRLSARAEDIQAGPDELRGLAAWVRGTGADEAIGILAQQLLGSLFVEGFVATAASWDAAETLVAAPRMSNLLKLSWWTWSGKVRDAKRLLAGMVNDDLSAVNAIGIAVHNVVKSLRHMRTLYANNVTRTTLTTRAAAEQSLFAPLSVFRQATTDGEFRGCPFSKNSLFVFAIGDACRQSGGRPLVFMDETWSQCPANVWVPAMLEGVWKCASSTQS